MAWHGFFCRGFSSIYRIAIYTPPYALVKYRNEGGRGGTKGRKKFIVSPVPLPPPPRPVPPRAAGPYLSCSCLYFNFTPPPFGLAT